MKKVAYAIVFLLLFVLLSFFAISQQPIVKKIKRAEIITPDIELATEDNCVTEFFEEELQIEQTCIDYYNSTVCLNTSGPDTDCSPSQKKKEFTCYRVEKIVKNQTTCKPNNDFLITIDDDGAVLKKRIDASDFGPCIYEKKDDCLIVTCQSMYDGAHLDQFTGCGSGSSCQKFEICEDGITTLYKNSRDDFVLEDEGFHLPKIAIAEVEE